MFSERFIVKDMLFEIESRVNYMESLEEKKRMIQDKQAEEAKLREQRIQDDILKKKEKDRKRARKEFERRLNDRREK